MQNTPLLLSTLLDNGAKMQPDNEIVTLIGGGKYHRITYAQHQTRVWQLASALSKQARRAQSASRSLRRALLLPQVHPGSRYHCGKGT